MLNNLNRNSARMRKLFATIAAFMQGKASIEMVDKTSVLRTPGDVTISGHQ